MRRASVTHCPPIPPLQTGKEIAFSVCFCRLRIAVGKGYACKKSRKYWRLSLYAAGPIPDIRDGNFVLIMCVYNILYIYGALSNCVQRNKVYQCHTCSSHLYNPNLPSGPHQIGNYLSNRLCVWSDDSDKKNHIKHMPYSMEKEFTYAKIIYGQCWAIFTKLDLTG